MDYRACFSCELLFEVTGVGEAVCPQCGGVLEPHQPSQIFSVDQPPSTPPAEFEDSMDERTRMVSRLDPDLLAGIPDPEDQRLQQPAHEMTKVSRSGFGEESPSQTPSRGANSRRAPEYRAVEGSSETPQRRVPLGRAVQSVDQTPVTERSPRSTGEHKRPPRSYGAASEKAAFRPPDQMGTGQRDISYRARSGSQIAPTTAGSPEAVTSIDDNRQVAPNRAFRSGGTREFPQAEPTAGRQPGNDGFTAVDGRDAHGGRRSIHRRKSTNAQVPVAVEIPIPVISDDSQSSMERTRMLDVGAGIEKTEMILQSELDEVIRSKRMSGGVPVSEEDEEARTRVVRRSDEFDALLQSHDGQAKVSIEPQRVPVTPSPVVLAPSPAPNPTPRRRGPDPRPRRDAQGYGDRGEQGGGPSPLPRQVSGGPPPISPPIIRPGPSPIPAQPVAVDISRSKPVDRGSHAKYFEAGIDDDVDLTDAIDAIVGDQLIQNLEAKRSTVSRQKHRRQRARAKWLLLLLPLIAITLLVVILVPRSEKSTGEQIDAGVAAQEASGQKLLTAIGRVGLDLPRIRGTQPLDDRAPFLAASNDALKTSFGPILGMTSSRVPKHLLDGPQGKQWIKPLRSALERADIPDRDTLILALGSSASLETVSLLGRSAILSGFDRVALVFDREEAGGGVGMLPFELDEGKLPSAGGALIRIGNLSVHTRIEGRDGRRLSEEMPEVVNTDEGKLDLEAIDARLERLSQAHPLVQKAFLYANRELLVENLGPVMQVILLGTEKERFKSIRLVVR